VKRVWREVKRGYGDAVKRVEGELYVALTAEAIERLGFREGPAVEGKGVETDAATMTNSVREVRYATVAETLEAFRKIEPLHREAFANSRSKERRSFG
jgi:hypothetical protein